MLRESPDRQAVGTQHMGHHTEARGLTIVDDCCEEVIHAMHSDVDRKQKADKDFICEHYCCLHHVKAVACESRRHIRPACVMGSQLRVQECLLCVGNSGHIPGLLHVQDPCQIGMQRLSGCCQGAV